MQRVHLPSILWYENYNKPDVVYCATVDDFRLLICRMYTYVILFLLI